MSRRAPTGPSLLEPMLRRSRGARLCATSQGARKDVTEAALEAVIARVRASNDPTLTADEVSALEAAATDSETARRLLGMHYYRAGRFADAERHARRSFEAEPGAAAAYNLWSVLQRLGRLEESLAHLDAAAAALDPADLATMRCATFDRLGRRPEALAEGARALALRDAATPRVDPPPPTLRAFDPARPERNVIAFSLFGAGRRYCEGAIRNAVVAPHLYPGWTARFYVDDSVPKSVRDRLRQEGAQLRTAPNLPAARFGTLWRFLVEDDPDVDLYLVRDADSVLNIRERAAVEDWLASGAPFHVMRDHPVHCDLMLAGMWGAHRGNLGPMAERMIAYVSSARKLNDRTADQAFLRAEVWPGVRRDALAHDAFYEIGRSRPFRSKFTLPPPMHVGQDDAARRTRRAPSAR